MTALLFGKMPSHGDFVARGLDPAARQLLDDWLSSEMIAARGANGLEFDRRYRTAPPWRFVLPELGGWRAGALSPSLDSAGRCFPLLASVMRETAESAAGAAASCEDMIYRALGEGWTADEMLRQLSGLTSLDDAPRTGWWTEGNAEFPPAALDGVRPAGLMTAMVQPAEQPA